jgi:tartrate dehydrogenase/decarboxylase/D-malate dehydrogenase
MMLDHIGETAAAARLMDAIETITVNKELHTPDLGGTATTDQVTDAIIDVIRTRNDWTITKAAQ